MDVSEQGPNHASTKPVTSAVGWFGRLALAVAVAGLLLVGGAIAAFRLEFGVFPPSRVNLIWWIDPHDPQCATSQRTYRAEDVPFIGTGVGIDDICFAR